MNAIRNIFSRFAGRRTPCFIGADTGGGKVRMLHLSGGGVKPFALERYAAAELPEGVIINGRIQNYETLSLLLRQTFCRAFGSIPRFPLPKSLARICAALPRNQSRIDTLPSPANHSSYTQSSETPSEKWLARHFPDGNALADTAAADGLPALIAAASRHDVEAYTEAFHDAGLPLFALDTEWTAYANAFFYWQAQQSTVPPSETCLLLVMHNGAMLGMAVQNSGILYAQELAAPNAPPAGHAYFPAPAGPFPTDGEALQISNTSEHSAVPEILRFIQFYLASPAAAFSDGISRLFLMGDAVPPEPFAAQLAAECGLPVETVCPPLLLAAEPSDEWARQAASFTLAFGLALRGADV